MVKYHIGKDGTPKVCKAKVKCTLGGDHEHFSSAEEAQAYADYKNKREIVQSKIHVPEGYDRVRRTISGFKQDGAITAASVDHSFISGFSYNENNKSLMIAMGDNHYTYYGVDKEVFNRMLFKKEGDVSLGKLYNSELKGQIEGLKNTRRGRATKLIQQAKDSFSELSDESVNVWKMSPVEVQDAKIEEFKKALKKADNVVELIRSEHIEAKRAEEAIAEKHSKLLSRYEVAKDAIMKAHLKSHFKEEGEEKIKDLEAKYELTKAQLVAESGFGERLQITPNGKLFVEGMTKKEWPRYNNLKNKLSKLENITRAEKSIISNATGPYTSSEVAAFQEEAKYIRNSREYSEYTKAHLKQEEVKERLFNAISESNRISKNISDTQVVKRDLELAESFNKAFGTDYSEIFNGRNIVRRDTDISDRVSLDEDGKFTNVYIKYQNGHRGPKGNYRKGSHDVYKVTSIGRYEGGGGSYMTLVSSDGTEYREGLSVPWNWRKETAHEAMNRIPDLHIGKPTTDRIAGKEGKTIKFDVGYYDTSD